MTYFNRKLFQISYCNSQTPLNLIAFNLFKAQAIDKESLLDLLEPPMKQLLKDKLKMNEAKQAEQKTQQQPTEQDSNHVRKGVVYEVDQLAA